MNEKGGQVMEIMEVKESNQMEGRRGGNTDKYINVQVALKNGRRGRRGYYMDEWVSGGCRMEVPL